jgi:DUF917 family protein
MPDNYEAEEQMRHASVKLGSLGGICINPVYGVEAKTLPPNSFSHGTFAPFCFIPVILIPLLAWSIGRSIALARSLKQDPITSLLKEHNGILLFTGKIISVTRNVSEGFTRGNVTIESISPEGIDEEHRTMYVDFENENLSAVLKVGGAEDEVLAVCPDLVQVRCSFSPFLTTLTNYSSWTWRMVLLLASLSINTG